MKVIPILLAMAVGLPAAAQELPPPGSPVPGPDVKVAVTAAAPLEDRSRSSIGQRINEQLTHALPLQTRNFIELASLAAGFTGNPAFPSAQGQTYWNTSVMVDGSSHYSKWRGAARAFNAGYGLESIQEIHVLTNRFSAEYGQALASVMSGLTRAGTDQWHGSTLVFWQDAALNAAPVFAAARTRGGSQQYGATLGGPLITGRTHLFGSYEGRRARTENPVVSPIAAGRLVPDREDEHLTFARVDHQLSPQHLVAARYSGQIFRWHHEPGGLALPGTGTELNTDVHTVLGTAASVISTTILNQARAQFAPYADRRRDLQPTVFIARAGYSFEGGTLGPGGFAADPEDTWEMADTLSFWTGGHAVKAGGGGMHVRAHNTFQNYGAGAYFFAGAPDAFPAPYLFIQGIAPTNASTQSDPRSTGAFGFVQDDWRVRSTLTVNLGVRYDVERISNVRGYAPHVDTNNVQPRLGVAWQPFADTVVRGGIGLYTQQHLLYYINRVALEGEQGVMTVAMAPDSRYFPAFPLPLPALVDGGESPPRDIHRVGNAFNNPYSMQASAGVEHTLPGAVAVTIDYVYLAGHDLMSLTDANAPSSLPKPEQRSLAAADATRPMVPLPNGYRKIVTLGNLGRSWYHALQIKVNRPIGRVQGVASYTLARAEDMANYQLPEDSRNIAAERARSDTDIRHNMTGGFVVDLDGDRGMFRGWRLSGVATIRSNRPYTVTWGDDRNGTTQNDARPGGRNTATTGPYRNVDLAVARRLRAGATTIEGRLEVFNVFSTVNFDDYVGSLRSPFFGQPVSAFPRRRLQVAAILRF